MTSANRGREGKSLATGEKLQRGGKETLQPPYTVASPKNREHWMYIFGCVILRGHGHGKTKLSCGLSLSLSPSLPPSLSLRAITCTQKSSQPAGRLVGDETMRYFIRRQKRTKLFPAAAENGLQMFYSVLAAALYI